MAENESPRIPQAWVPVELPSWCWPSGWTWTKFVLLPVRGNQ